MLSKFAVPLVLLQMGTSLAAKIVRLPMNENNCYLTGDPHVYPFDQTVQQYDNKVGDFNYVYGMDGNLVIQGHQTPCGAHSATCIREVAAQFCGLRFKATTDSKRWDKIHAVDDADSATTSTLPVGFKIETDDTVSILKLPDGSQVQVVVHDGLIDLTIQLPEKYNNKVKGMCGLKDGETFDKTGSYVNANDNVVCDIANIVSSKDNYLQMPALDDTVDCPYTCPSYTTDTTGDEVNLVDNDDTPLGGVVELSEESIDSDDMAPCVDACRAAANTALETANAELDLQARCTIANLEDLISACAEDMLNIQGDTATLELEIGDQCNPPPNEAPTENEVDNEVVEKVKCHLRHS